MPYESSPWDRSGAYGYDNDDDHCERCCWRMFEECCPVLACLCYCGAWFAWCASGGEQKQKQKQQNQQKAQKSYDQAMQDYKSRIAAAQHHKDIRDWSSTPSLENLSFKSLNTGNTLTVTIDEKKRLHLLRYVEHNFSYHYIS